MNSTQARDKAINMINEEGKEITVEFLMKQLDKKIAMLTTRVYPS